MRRVFSIKALIAAVLMIFAASNAWAGLDDPKTVVENTVDGIIKILEAREDTSKLTEKDRDEIRMVVAGRFDYREMSKRSLGKAGGVLMKVRRQTLQSCFANCLSAPTVID